MIENKEDSFDIENTILRENSSYLDNDQCIAAKETANVVVSAGAGSGKTTVLAARFAYLVEAKNIPVENILTLTFTKKAAAEMKSRIFNGLKNHSRGRDLKNKKNLDKNQANYEKILQRAQNAVENLDKAHVQTLDSYFSEIAKKGAHFYGIRPDFSLDDDKINSMIEFKAKKFVLDNLQNPALKAFSQKVKIQDMAKNLFSDPILKHSTIFSPVDFEGGLKKQTDTILKDYKEINDTIREKIENTAILIQNSSKKITDSAALLLKNLTAALACQLPPLTINELDSGKSDAIKSYTALLGKCVGNNSNPGKELSKQIKDLHQKLYTIINFIDGYAVQKEITSLLSEFQKNVNETKRNAGILTFSDVSQLAFRILKEHKDIRLIEQQKYDAIMIDEFQDDNQLQCDVLLILSDIHEKYDQNGNYIIPSLTDSDLNERLDSNKLFFVGDEKQSIYLFRGADVSVFRSLKSRLKNLNLGTNYRSDKALIQGYNTIFGGYSYSDDNQLDSANPAVFMTKEKFSAAQIPFYEAEYEKVLVPESKKDSSSQRQIIFADYMPPAVNETPAATTNADTTTNAAATAQNATASTDSTAPANTAATADTSAAPTDADEINEKSNMCEAQWVASEIHRLVEVEKKYRYKDIALLFRTSTPVSAYEKKLLQNKIPYSTEVYKGFFADGPINDILALLRLCAYPNDINSFARLLHSPFVNLTLEQTQLVLSYTAKNFKEPFAQTLIDSLKADELTVLAEKLEQGKLFYQELQLKLKTEKLTKTISYLWYDSGYRYETMWNRSVAMFNTLYDILFEMAHQAEQKTQGLAVFLDEIRKYEESDKKLDNLDVILDAEDSVNIMTIHASKGLEFPVVFVCAAANGKKDKGENSVKILEDYGLALDIYSCKKDTGNYFINSYKEQQEILDTAELRRLTYVAFTRAEKQLYVVGNYDGTFQGDYRKLAKRFEVHPENEKDFITYTSTGRPSVQSYVNPKTIYNMLLPLLNNYVTEDKDELKTAAPSSPFDFTGNPDDFDSKAGKTNYKDEANSPKAKAAFIVQNDYSAIAEENIIEQKKQLPVYISPSKIPHEAAASQNNSAASPAAAASPTANSSPDGTSSSTASAPLYASPLYEQINQLVLSTLPAGHNTEKLEDTDDAGEKASSALSPAFDFTNFGTIAHAYMEAAVKQTKPVISQNTITGLNGSKEKLKLVTEICQDMVERFKSCDLYREAVDSSWIRAEYDFRSFIKTDSKVLESLAGSTDIQGQNGIIVNGQIDLVYKNQENSPYKYTIVDYKTNQSIIPEVYYNQLTCYRDAVSKMLGCKPEEIRCVLYYLRFAQQQDITENCNQTELEKAIEAVLKAQN